jgi:hypothetical protein
LLLAIAFIVMSIVMFNIVFIVYYYTYYYWYCLIVSMIIVVVDIDIIYIIVWYCGNDIGKYCCCYCCYLFIIQYSIWLCIVIIWWYCYFQWRCVLFHDIVNHLFDIDWYLILWYCYCYCVDQYLLIDCVLLLICCDIIDIDIIDMMYRWCCVNCTLLLLCCWYCLFIQWHGLTYIVDIIVTYLLLLAIPFVR